MGSSCFCTAMAPTETTSSNSAARGGRSCLRPPSSRLMRRSAVPARRWGGNGLRSRTARRTIRPGPKIAGAAPSRRAGRSTLFSTPNCNASNSTNSKLALVGFSQGSMMAMHVGLRRSRAPAAIVGYSGMIVGAERLSEATARDARGAPPPILLIHGDQDPMISLEAMFMASEALASAQDVRSNGMSRWGSGTASMREGFATAGSSLPRRCREKSADRSRSRPGIAAPVCGARMRGERAAPPFSSSEQRDKRRIARFDPTLSRKTPLFSNRSARILQPGESKLTGSQTGR